MAPNGEFTYRWNARLMAAMRAVSLMRGVQRIEIARLLAVGHC